ncbi:S1C family serine protease [Mesobacillus zeae]
MAGLGGALVGGLLVISSIPTLSNMDFLPYDVVPDNQSAVVPKDKQKNGTSQNVSLNVQTDITKAVDKAAPAVVGITNIQQSNFWEEGAQEGAGATGSGVIYKKEGNKAFVVTNHHVIEGAAKLEVTLKDGTKLPAKLRGSDRWTDLAVLEVAGDKVKTAVEFGDSEALKAGEPVIAIGNPLGSTFSGSVTQGIISGLQRTIPVDIDQDGVPDWQAEVIQTDAAINPGNSGGALINIAGQLVGINSMKIAEQAVEGIGLSIPINYAQPIIDDLEKFGDVKRPYMGVDMRAVNEIPAFYQQEALKLPKDVDYGVALRSIVPGSPADKAGLKELDVIVEMDGEKMNDVIDLRKHLYNKKKIGDKLEIKYYREGKLNKTTMTLVENVE